MNMHPGTPLEYPRPTSLGRLIVLLLLLVHVLGCTFSGDGDTASPPPITGADGGEKVPPPTIPQGGETATVGLQEAPPTADFPGVAREYPDADGEGPADRQDRIVEVFYGTDRQWNPDHSGPEDYYGGERGELELGICRVNIPPDHQLGELEEPKWYRLEFRWNPERHVMVLDIRRRLPEDTWLQAVNARIARSEERSAFVFVHGYNTTFNDAARRAGQMAYDLRFEGAPILYSWPSKGALAGYTVDENNVRNSVRHLRTFLELVVQRSEAKIIHLIAHSMGNRALTAALERLAAAMPKDSAPLFNQIALVAPDVDAEVFKQDIMPAIQGVGSRISLYASAHDKALEASSHVHGGYPRAGNLEDGVVIAPGLDTIDASDVETSFLAHSYFAETASVISDLILLFDRGLEPAQRGGLTAVDHPEGVYWKLVAQPSAP